MKARFLIWTRRRMWTINNNKNWNKHKWCKTKLGSRRQKYLALLQEMNNIFSQLFVEIKWRMTSFTLGFTLVFSTHHLMTVYLTISLMALLHCFLLDLTHFTHSIFLSKNCLHSITCWINLKFNPTQFMATCLLELLYS